MVLASSTFDIPVSATPICNNARGGSEGGIGATLLVLSSLKHLKYLQTYTYFQAQARLCISLRQAMGDIRCWKFNLCYLAILS